MGETNLNRFKEVTPGGTFTLQNSSLLEVRLDGNSVQAKLGSMVAYQGGGLDLMVAGGTGDLFLVRNARKIMIFELEGETMTVNGDNILAFEEGVDWDMVPLAGAGLAGGASNVVLHDTGKVAVTAQGDPVLLDTNTPASADPDPAIAWSGGVHTRARSDVSFNTFLGRDSGETFQIAFEGPGWVPIQRSEDPTVPPHTHARQG
jgi:uncharacterized protein (AIM24 family)